MANLKGERVRIYENKELLKRVKSSFPNAIEWKNVGLPVNFMSLIAPLRKAFVTEGKKVVSHGGISIEELIIPLVHIQRR
ncbi:MAG: hypothetical protein ACOCRO_07580 [Halanaerobiales bacterium]